MAILGRPGRGLAVPVFAERTAAAGDWAHSWGELPGPAIVEHLWVSTSNQDAGARTVPMVFAGHIGHVEAADLSGFLLQGITLLPAAGYITGGRGWPHEVIGPEWWRFWPRQLIPWARWAPGFVTLGAAPGGVTVVIFGVRFPGW